MKAENIYLSKFNEWLIIKQHTSRTAYSFCKTTGYFLAWIKEENIEAENVSYNDVLAYANYLKKKGNKPQTVQLTVNAIKHFYNCLLSENSLPLEDGCGEAENPCSNVEIKGIKRKILHEILSPEELENIYKNYSTTIDIEQIKKIKNTLCVPPQVKNELTRKRNKIILGLLIYQGMRTEEIEKLELPDLQLREGKINIPGSRRTESRTLKLESHQIIDLFDYINTTRKQLLEITKKSSKQLFISKGSSMNLANSLQRLIQSIKEENPKVKNIKQIRTSVISNWLKTHNLRKVQYMAGHRYVSSTEAYQQNNIEELQDDIKKYHPIG